MKTLQEQKKTYSPSHNPQAPIQNPKSTIEMRELTTDSAVAYAIALLSHYKFELRGYTAKELVNLWLRNYSAHWVRLGVIEALYQGRYKAVSVDQILSVWARRGQPIYRFNREFERLISRKLPQNLTVPLDPALIDLIQESNLPPLPFSEDDTLKEQAVVETMADDSAWTDKPNTPLTVTKTPAEDLTDEIPAQSDDQLPKMFSTVGTNPSYDTDWSRCEVKKQPIHQFTPPPDSSDFYLKLKAVVHQQESTPAKVMTTVVNQDKSEPSESRSEHN